MENKTLIHAARNGDKKALCTLLDHYRGYMAAIVLRYVDDKEQQKDILQNIFIRIIKGLTSYKDSSKFTTWLYKVALSEIYDSGRKMKTAGKYFTSLHSEPIQTGADSDTIEYLNKKEVRKIVLELLELLPLDQKTAFILYYLHYYCGKDAAEIMNISEQNFFMKLKAARDFLRKKLSKEAFYE
ncbi:RNA polymerase sigma factor RpoE [Chitinispirillum alkaliphilum]|nr:RNA polymerase sigma factor RpoE [Chitinispirillum alkaliphilum]